MTSFTDIQNDVYTITNRPDYVNETIIAIKNATLTAHRSDFYIKDLWETGIQFPASDYLQSLEPKLLSPYYRSMKYLRKYDAVNLCAGMLLTPVSVDEVFDSYAMERVNIYYGAGAEVQIKMNTQEQYLLLGMYLHPVVIPASYKSWIADEFPELISNKAAATVFKLQGKTVEANMYDALANDAITELKASNITMMGG